MESAAISLRESAKDLLLKICPTSGRISAVFNNSFDVRCLDLLLNFNISEEKLHPASVLIERDLLEYVAPGMIVKMRYPDIQIGQRNLQVGRVIPEMKDMFCNLETGVVLSNLAILKRSKKKIFSGMYHVIENLKDHLKGGFLFGREFINYFGSGDGLTPAFDDFFSGMLFVDRTLNKGRIKTDEFFFNHLLKKTTLTSFWQLRFADEGKMSLIFERFMRKILNGKISAKDVFQCMNVGHSSGTYILSGMETYLWSFVTSC